MRKSLRYLRFTWSGLCVIACVLLVVLWVRSYWWMDTALFPYRHATCVLLFSLQGQFGGSVTPYSTVGIDVTHSRLIYPIVTKDDHGQIAGGAWIQFLRFTFSSALYIPYWIPVFATLLLAAVPWIRWPKRFTLRILLIATTLVAVVLGLVVWLR
jgi:hypothetical protein